MRITRSFVSFVRLSGWVPAALLFGLACAAMRAQTAEIPKEAAAESARPLPVYDVVTIKQNKSDNGMIRIGINENTFSATNLAPKSLVADAYGVHEDDVFGMPEWTNGAHFDITCKTLDPDPKALSKLKQGERGAMLKPVLAERFKLQAHMETKILPVYELVIAKGEPKLVKFVDSDVPDKVTGHKGGGWMSMRNTTLNATGVEMAALVNFLTDRLHRKVIDKTGITGKYNINLDWTSDDAAGDSGESSDASLLTALQEQLGLKLESAKGPVDTVVVDHIEMPSED